MRFTKISLPFIAVVCCLFFHTGFLFAQQNFDVKPKFTTVMVPQAKKIPVKIKSLPLTSLKKAEADIDSLNSVIEQNKADYAVSEKMNTKKDSMIEEMDQKIAQLQNANDDFERKLLNYRGENLKLDQSNRILIIFNSIVGVLLLSTLVWFLRNINKKKPANKIPAALSYEMTSTAEAATIATAKTNHQYFENKLEQLEKLGKLKERGILTDEEFNKQKQQILGSNS